MFRRPERVTGAGTGTHDLDLGGAEPMTAGIGHPSRVAEHDDTGLWWGTAAAAVQCEGAPARSDWAGWEAAGRAPASSDGNGFRTRYADDLTLLAEHGIRHHRLTVEWARLEPRPGAWDEDEVAHLRRVLRAGDEAGVRLWACLLHGSAPGWFTDDERGWLDDKAVLVWARHVDRLAEAIGDLVAGWMPIHEPEGLARLGYGDGTFPPGRHRDDDRRDARAALLAAEAEAARLLASGPAPVALTARPADLPDDPVRDHGLLVVNAPVEGLESSLEHVADTHPDADLLIVTGDPGGGASGAGPGTGERSEFAGDGDPVEGGASGDEQRGERLRRTVSMLTGAHAGGLRVRGAFHQPAIDGYEWHRGFSARLGLFDRDRNPHRTLDAWAHGPARG
jgi:beta-glucosidase